MLPVFCFFYRMQPSEFWALDNDEVNVLGEWMKDYQREQKRAARR